MGGCVVAFCPLISLCPRAVLTAPLLSFSKNHIAVDAIDSVSLTPENRQMICKVGGVPLVAALVTRVTSGQVRVEAVRLVNNLAYNPLNRKIFSDTGTLETLRRIEVRWFPPPPPMPCVECLKQCIVGASFRLASNYGNPPSPPPHFVLKFRVRILRMRCCWRSGAPSRVSPHRSTTRI